MKTQSQIETEFSERMTFEEIMKFSEWVIAQGTNVLNKPLV